MAADLAVTGQALGRFRPRPGRAAGGRMAAPAARWPGSAVILGYSPARLPRTGMRPSQGDAQRHIHSISHNNMDSLQLSCPSLAGIHAGRQPSEVYARL